MYVAFKFEGANSLHSDLWWGLTMVTKPTDDRWVWLYVCVHMSKIIHCAYYMVYVTEQANDKLTWSKPGQSMIIVYHYVSKLILSLLLATLGFCSQSEKESMSWGYDLFDGPANYSRRTSTCAVVVSLKPIKRYQSAVSWCLHLFSLHAITMTTSPTIFFGWVKWIWDGQLPLYHYQMSCFWFALCVLCCICTGS